MSDLIQLQHTGITKGDWGFAKVPVLHAFYNYTLCCGEVQES